MFFETRARGLRELPRFCFRQREDARFGHARRDERRVRGYCRQLKFTRARAQRSRAREHDRAGRLATAADDEHAPALLLVAALEGERQRHTSKDVRRDDGRARLHLSAGGSPTVREGVESKDEG